MAVNDALCDMGVDELSGLVRQRAVSPLEIVDSLLARIEALDGELHAFVTVASDYARSRASHAEREIAAGEWRGPLHGVPFAAKDLLASGAIPSEVGMALFRGRTTPGSAAAIERMEGAGAILLGKLRQTEGTLNGYHPDDPVPVSPWAATHWPGASSSGSGIALAARMIPVALSSDTGGSIRTPSAVGGLTGLMPSMGRVSLDGAFPIEASLDRVGPMARSARDCAMALTVLAGHDPRDPYSSVDVPPDYALALEQPLTGMTIGIPYGDFGDVDPRIVAAIDACRASLELSGVRFVEVGYPVTAQALRAWVTLCMAGTAHAHRQSFADSADRYGPSLALAVRAGLALTACDVIEAAHARQVLCAAMDEAFSSVDAMLLPVLLSPAPTIADLMAGGGNMSDAYVEQARYQGAFNLTGQPSVAFPAGKTAQGMPIGIQLVGRRMEDGALLRVVHAFQQATDWHRRKPASLG